VRSSEQPTKFGIWFLHELSLRGWSQADYARKSGAHTRRISDWLYRSTPDLESVAKIAEHLSIPIGTVAARALDRPDQFAEPIAAEIGELAKSIPEKLLVPIAIALRSLQNPEVQEAALKDLEA
jgi:transcriptional regulator with XRE-family HTH domain